MAHKVPAPQELITFATANGWTVNEFLPDRFDACATVSTPHGTVTVTRETDSKKWMWTVDKGGNWGRGNRLGRAHSLLAAVSAALGLTAQDTLF